MAKLGIKPNAGLAAIRDVAGGGTLRTVTTATQRGTTMQWGTCQAQSGANVVVLLDGSASAVVVPVAPDLKASSCVGRRVLVAGRSAADWVVVAGGDSNVVIPPQIGVYTQMGTAQSVSGANLMVLLDGASSAISIPVVADMKLSSCVGRRVVVVGTNSSNYLVTAGGDDNVTIPTQVGVYTQLGTAQSLSGTSLNVLLDGAGSTVAIPVASDIIPITCVGKRVVVVGKTTSDYLVTSVIGASRIVARAGTITAQSIPHNTITIVDYNVVTLDPFNTITTGAGWKFTAPQTGNYLVVAYIMYALTNTWALGEVGQLEIYKNGSRDSIIARDSNMDTNTIQQLKPLGNPGLVNLTVGDTLDIRTIQTSGAALALHTSAGSNTVAIALL